MPLIRMNALTTRQWEALLTTLSVVQPQNAGWWDIDWSDDMSDCES